MSEPGGFEGINPGVLAAWQSLRPERQLRDPGPDFISRKQLQQLWRIGSDATTARLAELVKSGAVVSAVRDVLSGRRTQPVTVYKLLEAPRGRSGRRSA